MIRTELAKHISTILLKYKDNNNVFETIHLMRTGGCH